MTVIKSLYVEKFRKLRDIEIPIGKRLTVIAGQNATMKSTILGMLGQPFGLTGHKTIYGTVFRAKFGEAFKWSPTYDKPREHKYRINFISDEFFGKETEVIESFERTKSSTHIRLVTGERREIGDGNIDFPVLYLSLKRVFPIGSLTKVTETQTELSSEEANEYIANYNRIMLNSNDIRVSDIKGSSQKMTIAAATNDHDGLTISAGQDNLGQILGAIISFKRLKKSIGDAYKGGLLLIDEVDATLHSSARTKLISFLFRASRELNLQIVFTTHSLEIIQLVQEKYCQQKDDCIVLYFKRVADGNIEFSTNRKYKEIVADLNAEVIEADEPVKFDIFCEDDEAASLIKLILSNKYKKLCNIVPVGLGCSVLKSIADSKAPNFKEVIYCLDGDTPFGNREKTSSGKPKRENLILLPGKNISPELLFYNFLYSIPDDDKFYSESDNQYTKQVYLNHRPDPKIKYDRVVYKSWFNTEQKLWAPKYGLRRIFGRWAQDNQVAIDEFNNDFVKAYNIIACIKGMPNII